MASEPRITFYILGPIEIRVDGRSIPLPGGHARSIIGLLLLHPNRVLSSDDLIDALWRENPPRTAPNVLQAHVATLRRALRAGGEELVARLETHPSGYLLRVEPEELDAEVFGAEVADAERIAPADPGTAVDRLRRALARWRGGVDAGGPESSSAVGATARLEELRLSASETMAELNLRLRRAREVVADLEPLAREFPFRERFHALMMIALYRSGPQADFLGLRSQLHVQTLNRGVDDSILGSKRAVLLGKLANASHGGLRQVVGAFRSGTHVGRSVDVSDPGVSIGRPSQIPDSGCGRVEISIEDRELRTYEDLPDSPVRALGAARDAKHDDEPRRILNHVDHAKIPDPDPPEVRPRQLRGTGRSRIEREGEDGAPKCSGRAGRQATKLPLGRGRQLDTKALLAHP